LRVVYKYRRLIRAEIMWVEVFDALAFVNVHVKGAGMVIGAALAAHGPHAVALRRY
jgi:hypothetical protein